MSEDNPANEELLRMLSAMQPPDIPESVFTAEHPGILACRKWHKNGAAALLGGLQTDPQFHANGIRFDWLLRLVLAKAEGRQKPTRYDLSRILNGAFSDARILSLEDPIEDLFCERISSERGNFRIFSGQWESAGAYTQTLLDAFETLPDAEQKTAALTSVYALLRLSDEVASRGRVDLDTRSGGTPQEEIELPSPDALRQLVRSVQFTDADLAEIGIVKAALIPYFLEPDQFPYVSDRPIGDTPLEFHPLLGTSSAIVLVSPANVSIAVRSFLISTAIRGGMGSAFQEAILVRQEQYTNEGSFWPLPLSLSAPNEFFIRRGICEYERGRYVHVVQLPGLFDDFPSKAFGTVEELSPAAASFLSDEVEGFWDFAAGQEGVTATATVILMSGWGKPGWLDPAIDEKKSPPHWQYFAMSFSDCGVMGVVPDARFTDICRVLRQEERLASDGFELRNMNGILNLLGAWNELDPIRGTTRG